MRNETVGFKNKIQDYGALIALVLLVIVISIISPEFRTIDNFLSLLRQSSINGLIAFGMTCVILTGGIDLSVGSTLALSAALCAGMIVGGIPAALAILLCLVLGSGLGAVNGLMVTAIEGLDEKHSGRLKQLETRVAELEKKLKP